MTNAELNMNSDFPTARKIFQKHGFLYQLAIALEREFQRADPTEPHTLMLSPSINQHLITHLFSGAPHELRSLNKPPFLPNMYDRVYSVWWLLLSLLFVVVGTVFSLPSPLIPPPRCFCGNLVSMLIAFLLKGGGPISPTSTMSKVDFGNKEVEKFGRGALAVMLTSISRRPGADEGRGFMSSLPGVKGLGGATGASL